MRSGPKPRNDAASYDAMITDPRPSQHRSARSPPAARLYTAASFDGQRAEPPADHRFNAGTMLSGDRLPGSQQDAAVGTCLLAVAWTSAVGPVASTGFLLGVAVL